MAKKNNQSLANRNSSLSRNDTQDVMLTANDGKGKLDISLVLLVAGKELILTGDSFKDGINVAYSSPWAEAPELGSFLDGIHLLADVLGKPEIEKWVKDSIASLPYPLRGLTEFIVNAQLILTDLVINTTGKKLGPDGTPKDEYTLGLGFKFPKAQKVSGIAIQAFLVKYSYLADHKKKP
jgi:hypothetical protein